MSIKQLLYLQEHGTEAEKYEADQKLDSLAEWWEQQDQDEDWIREQSDEHI